MAVVKVVYRRSLERQQMTSRVVALRRVWGKKNKRSTKEEEEKKVGV
jgi:hypothetical protein